MAGTRRQRKDSAALAGDGESAAGTQGRDQAVPSPSSPPAGGRPTKRNPLTEGAILAAVGAGATYELAAKAGGITYETFNEWRKADPQFSEAIARVEYEAALSRLNMIAAAARDDWKAAAWWLERRFPESYGRQVRAQVDHGGQIKIRIERVNDWRALGKADIETTSSSSAEDAE
jgi:transposase